MKENGKRYLEKTGSSEFWCFWHIVIKINACTPVYSLHYSYRVLSQIRKEVYL